MRLVKYKVIRLNEPEGQITHQLVYESKTKNGESGGFGCGIRHRGTYRECLERKRELENGIRESKETGSMVFTETPYNQ